MTRLISAFAILLALASCGFTPMYGSAPGGSGMNVTQGLDKVEIDLIPDQSGVYLRNILIDHFYKDGYPSNPLYVLHIAKIQETRTDLDITIESEATRQKIRLRAVMVLSDKATGETVLTRSLTAISSYNIIGSQFTTRVSEDDAREAALEDLARQTENQIALYLKK